MSGSLSLEQIPGALRQFQSGRILLVTHIRPDGDALGSLCGLLELLRDQGFQTDAVLPERIPDYYREFLPGR